MYDLPTGEKSWVKRRKPILAQLEPVQWIRNASEESRRSLSITRGFIVDALAVLEFAHRPQCFQRRRGHLFVDRGADNVQLFEALPLPALEPPWKSSRELPPRDPLGGRQGMGSGKTMKEHI